jgi:hypothetical protein
MIMKGFILGQNNMQYVIKDNSAGVNKRPYKIILR